MTLPSSIIFNSPTLIALSTVSISLSLFKQLVYFPTRKMCSIFFTLPTLSKRQNLLTKRDTCLTEAGKRVSKKVEKC